MMDQFTQPDQHDKPEGIVIYEDARIKQIHYPDKDLIIQLDKIAGIVPVIIKRKLNPAWVEAGKHPHGVLAINEHSYDIIKINPPNDP